MIRPWFLRALVIAAVLALLSLVLAEAVDVRNRLARGERLKSPRATEDRIRRSHP